MATQLLKVIDTDGTGDYASIAIAEATNMDLVTLDNWLDLECKCTSGTADTSSDTTFNGWDCDSTRYINIYTHADYRHAGVWDNTKYRITSTGNYNNGIGVTYISSSSDGCINITGLQISISSGSGANAYGVSINSTTISCANISKCIIYNANMASNGRGTGILVSNLTNGGRVNSYNNIIYDFTNSYMGTGLTMSDAGGYLYAYNDTIVNCYNGIKQTFGDIYIYNCLLDCKSWNASYTDITGTITAQDYNSGSGTTTTGTHSRINQTFTYVDKNADDFRITSADTGAKDYGVTNPGSGLFSDDIAGTSRPQGTAWDIGAFEVLVASGATIPVLVNHYKQQGVM